MHLDVDIALLILARLVPIAIAGPPIGVGLLRAGSEWDRLEVLTVGAIGTVALGSVAVVAGDLVSGTRARPLSARVSEAKARVHDVLPT